MKKYRLFFLIFSILVFGYLAIQSGYNFAIGHDKGDNFMGVIAYGIGVIYFSGSLFGTIKNNKRNNSREV